jgi:GntR family transcriptional regulator
LNEDRQRGFEQGVYMFEVDFRSRKSIYEQVADNIKELILMAVVAPDEKLPSVRELAGMLTVNPNTVQKAYGELERRGYVYTVSGVGTFAARRSDISPDRKLIEETERRLADDVRELYLLGVAAGEIRALTDAAIEHIERSGK